MKVETSLCLAVLVPALDRLVLCAEPIRFVLVWMVLVASFR